MNTVKKHWDKFAFAGILLLAALLSIWGIWNEGYGNEFYAAAVKSMLTSWKNFFFVSLDPGGWVTVDKPPVSLWVQAAFAKVLGFHGWSIILPECMAAVATVAVTGHVVKRYFGKAAGLISALALALSPIFIVVSKTNNTDSVLILLMVLSVWAMTVAADTGRLRYLLLSMVILGIAYNAKTLEAFLILPALYAMYFFTVNRKWRTRIRHLALATVVLAAVSLSWSVIVDLTPASERPYVDNSTNNSELELAFGYNGIQRITGQTGKRSGNDRNRNFTGNAEMRTGSGASNGFGMPGRLADASRSNANRMADGNSGGGPGGNFGGNNGGTAAGGFGGGNTTGGAFGGGMFSGGGSAGILRMFNTTLGGQDSWLLPFGLFAILALILQMRKSAGTDAERRRKLLRNILLWGVSLVTMVGYFSVSSFFHPYYISALTPFLAALVGIGTVEMWKMYRKQEGPTGFLLPAALTVTLVVQIYMLVSYPSYARVLIPLAAVLTGIPAVMLTAAKCVHKEQLGRIGMDFCVGVAVAGLLISPAAWTSSSVVAKSFNAQIPSAGPTATGTRSRNGGNFSGSGQTQGNAESFGRIQNNRTLDRQGGMGMGGSSRSETKLIDFLIKNSTGEKFLIAVSSASEAEPIILATGKPVMAIGGFSGNDNTLSVAELKQMVKAGQLKYFLTGGRGWMGGSTSSDLTAWVEANGTKVDSSKWNDSSQSAGDSSGGNMGRSGSSGALYDLSSYQNK